MAQFMVEQTIARKRVVLVSAQNKAEAVEKARDGYGEIVENERKGSLLASNAEKVET
jgi:hypothetical protein